VRRVVEPELMINPQQVLAYSEADFSSSDRNIIKCLQELIQKHQKKIDKETLMVDLGCGPGNISQRMAQQWPQAEIIGIDGSDEMLNVARKRKTILMEKQLSSKLSYLNLDIAKVSKEIDLFHNSADIVVSNSLLHHLHDPQVLWNSIRSISKKGTLIFNRDLRRPLTNEDVIAKEQSYLPHAPSVLKRDYRASLKAAFTRDEVRKQLESAELDFLKVIEIEDSYLDVVGIFM
tara:strand:- start:27 stop:725 length:699 start_codon:yes stop_codon:yes gene_type:complete